MSEYKEVRKAIKERLVYWINRLDLNSVTIKTHFCYVKDKNEPETIAQTFRRFDYNDARIYFYLPNITKNNVDSSIVHELIHIIFAGYDNRLSLYVTAIETLLKGDDKTAIMDCLWSGFTEIIEKTTVAFTNIVLRYEKEFAKD